MKNRIQCWPIFVLLTFLVFQPLSGRSQGTAFIYQGQLGANGSPANGNFDLKFTLFNTNSGGVAVAGPLTNSATAITNGVFSVTLDFGPGVFIGSNLWLDIGVSPAGSNTFTELTPRQAVLPVPYSIFAAKAGSANMAASAASVAAANISGPLSLQQLPVSVVTNNGSSLTLSGTFTGNGGGLTNLLNGVLSLAPTNIIYINFDSVNTSTGRVDATAYLASFDVTLTNVSPSGTVYIDNSMINGCGSASSPPNFLSQDAPGSPPCSFTLLFNTPLQSVTFTRCAVGNNCESPIWTVTAYAGPIAISSTGVCCINSDLGQPAHIYTLNGPGITSLTISANGEGSSAISSPPLDDFYLVPENTLNVNGAVTATSFTGNGGSLTGLNPTNFSSGTAAINITGNAATATSATSAATATTANNFSGSLSGDVTGTQGATVVSKVGGVTAANVASGANAANGATSANTANMIVARDVNGNFSAGTITASYFSGPGGGLTGLPLTGVALFDGAGTNESFYGTTFLTNITGPANQTLVLQPGNINPNGNSGNGGSISILGGNAGASSGGSGGNLVFQAGGAVPIGGSGYGNLGPAGTVTILGGNGYNNAGGNVTIASGPNTEWSQAINGYSEVLLEGGAAVYPSNDFGSIAIEGGHNESDENIPIAAGGNITISGGNADGAYTGGNIVLLPGTGTPNGYIGLPDPAEIYSSTNSLLYSSSLNGNFFAGLGAGNSGGANNTAIGYDADPSGSGNDTAVGYEALQLSGPPDNTAVGYQALQNNLSGSQNTAVGYEALQNNSLFGAELWNTAVGYQALQNNDGNGNTAVGYQALLNNNGFNLFSPNLSSDNTAVGFLALASNTGNNNIGLGYAAGVGVTTNSNNIDIGNAGTNTDDGVIRIGTTNVQKSAYIAGIYGVTAAGSVDVKVSADGKLGTTTSSARFKTDIHNMGNASDILLALHPVTFKYKPELDPQGIPEFGLIAEEVQKVDPDLVVLGPDGKPYTVRYDAVNAMLLNEFLKEHKTIQDLKQQNDALATQLSDLENAVKKLEDKNRKQE